MITSLSIENFALIDKLSIGFSGGFSIITGETGAGKSILLGALGLVLGKRADLTSLKNKEKKCVIEAEFKLADYDLKSFFTDNDLDYEDLTIIRREILPSGKSRAFINDSPVNLQELQDLAFYLIDIHSQNETRELAEEDFQFKILDAVAGNKVELSQYVQLLKQYKKQVSELSSLRAKLQNAVKEQDYNMFLLEELLSANLVAGEQEELEAQQRQLSNVEFIKENFDKAIAIGNEEQYGLLHNLREFKATLKKNASISPDLNDYAERAESIYLELSDVISELEDSAEKLFDDPQQLELINQKLQLVYNLQKKHQVSTVEELIQVRNDLDNQALSLSELEADIEVLETQINEAATNLNQQASIISKKRIDAIPVLSQKLMAILEQLGMPHVRFRIDITAVDEFLPNGTDEIKFLFSANKGSDFGLLKKVASGGEMSRIMLAVKSVLAQYSALPTIIFDEIDTGVSGEIADKMGNIMQGMSGRMQLFAITHLPQIAAKGHAHFKVFKVVSDEGTTSELKLLDHDERIQEIAQMLSGSSVSDSAINHAKALLN
ncbi:MAG TPA: DNA repair protein RecN [Flavobacterium sp.]|jgi:DNA repair protein RecN (Recombination protein N)